MNGVAEKIKSDQVKIKHDQVHKVCGISQRWRECFHCLAFPKTEGIFSLSENFSPEKYFTLKYNILE